MNVKPSPHPTARSESGIRLLPLLTAIVIMLGITAWPAALSDGQGSADHWAATALFWAMSAGFIVGVGFQPRFFAWRLLFSTTTCLLGVAVAVARMTWLWSSAT